MDNFVNISTVYSLREELTLANMYSKYSDDELLIAKIEGLIAPFIVPSNIRGKKILLKPNWVRHNIRVTDEFCLCTNEHFILAVLVVFLKLSPKSVLIADAPIQGCKWECLLSSYFLDKVKKLSLEYGIDIQIKDFRRTIIDIAYNKIQRERISLDNYVIFDVGTQSYLEPITTSENRFRVTNYNPDRLVNSHRKGVHKYCIAKDVFDVDIVIPLPKIKTHQKAGLTNAMKILVGVNGDKDFLPHHRLGAKGYGGDCYPEYNLLRSCSEWCLDTANRRIGKPFYRCFTRMSTAFWKLSFPTNEQNLGAGWYGNDTVWRMVMDLNLIVEYGKMDGTLSNEKQREIYNLCDGIICGQGDGPLNPEPLPLGVIAFSNNSYLMDLVAGKLFSLDIDCIPLLNAAKQKLGDEESILLLNGNQVCMDSLNQWAVTAKMPPGWVKYKDSKR